MFDLQFEVWVSNDTKIYLTEGFLWASVSRFQRFRCQFLQVQSLSER